MNAHPFDPVSAVFGVAATGGGALVIAGASDAVDGTASGAWVAVIALAVGVVLLPWGRRTSVSGDRESGNRESGEDAGPSGSEFVDLDA